MDRLFLDANIFFSAAYSGESGLLRLWKLPGVSLCSSRYALEEARRNLNEEQRQRLLRLLPTIEWVDARETELPTGISLREKDVPILMAAIEAAATHLITGDAQDFGRYFGRTIEGVVILRPAEYLRQRGVT